jgi:hypothetical protein
VRLAVLGLAGLVLGLVLAGRGGDRRATERRERQKFRHFARLEARGPRA